MFQTTPAHDPPPATIRARLRLLATTDLHANLLPFDYFANQDDQPYGLARIATLIRTARGQACNVVLVDNGDALQGTPLGDITAQDARGWPHAHPMIAAMNHLGYDAAGLGNHEFNFGLDWLTRTLADARFPIACANIDPAPGAAIRLPPPFVLLPRRITDTAGRTQVLTLGVLGLVPAQITVWDSAHLAGRLTARDMVETARAMVPRMRRAGADLVIALAHTGIDAGPPRPGMENSALPLAALPGVDAIVAGHSHEVFPAPGGPPRTGVDPARGTLGDTPAVMAGFRGSHLGVLDLDLERRGGTWRIAEHHAEARPVAPAQGAAPVPADPDLRNTMRAAHDSTLALISRPVGRAAQPLHTYLALAGNSAAIRLVTRAQRAALRCAVAGTADETLPILAASAPFKTGGRGGPQHFTDIPAGPLSLRHAADLCGFPNTLCGVRLTGADLREWLERAAICFARITPSRTDQMLCDPGVPGHVFDLIDGLTYAIDLSAPPRYTATGAIADPAARRIRDLRHRGHPVADDARFLLATNSYRASGAGPFAAWPPSAMIHLEQAPLQDVLVEYLHNAGPIRDDAPPGWRFVPMPDTCALLDTGPGVRAHPDALAAARATDLGQTDHGFARLRIAL